MAQAPPWEGLGGPHCGGTRSFPQASVRRGRHARTVQIVGEVSAPGDKDSKDSTSAGGLTGGGAGPETAAPRAEAGRAAPPVPPHRTAPRPLTACAPAAVTVLKKPPGPRPRDDERVGAAHAVTAGPRLPLPRATCNASRQGGCGRGRRRWRPSQKRLVAVSTPDRLERRPEASRPQRRHPPRKRGHELQVKRSPRSTA